MVELEKFGKTFDALMEEMNKVVIGQDKVIKQIVAAILSDGNALLESYPGLGKTLICKTLAQAMDLKFSRIQGTPDLMPSDVTGTQMIEEVGGKRYFKFQQGPIFSNIVLVDEVNRATPKTQSALLEAMAEKQTTVSNKTYEMDSPFFILATQNPIDQEGTYPLPEAQQDRFLLKIKVDYPSPEDELKIVDQYAALVKAKEVKKVITKANLLQLQEYARQVPISNDLKQFVVKLITLTRTKKELIEYGASPRASIGLILAAKSNALIEGRNHVGEKDIIDMAYPVLRHRIIVNFEAERQGKTTDDIIKELIEKVK
jgi:MoxR-like ATPase